MIQIPSKAIEEEMILDYVSASILKWAALFLLSKELIHRIWMGIHNAKFTKKNEN